jgi:hypothetical protein
VVEGSSRSVVVIDWGGRLLGSVIWSQQNRYREKGKQSNREYSSKVISKADIRTILVMQHFLKKAVYVDLTAEMIE